MNNKNLQVDLNETILPKDSQAIAKAEELGRRLAGRTSVVPETEADPLVLFNSPQEDAVILAEMYKEMGIRIVGKKL